MSFIEEKSRMIQERGARDRKARGPASFWDEMRVIPVTARVLAALAYACCLTLILSFYAMKPEDWRNWNEAEKIAFAALMPIFGSAYVLLIGYVTGDAKRRGMRYIVWTFLAIFIPNALGLILYFLLRDPLPSRCPKCGTIVGGTFAFCPNCAAALAPACPNCKRSVEADWANCPYCGSKLGTTSQPAA